MFITDTPPEIVITASRSPERTSETAASVTLIDPALVDRLAPPLSADLLRLAPSVAVATGGPAGSLTQVRIRGAEANHTLLFIDGIRANDPAAANEPRFELLNADLATRLEIVRGPQSALWGSEAIGGVIAVEGAGPDSGPLALAEAGSFGFRRAAARGTVGDNARFLTFGVAAQGADGIDAFDGTGDRDGYRNVGGRVAGEWRLSPVLNVGGSGFALAGRSQFDGYSPVTFLHADTLDESRNRLRAGRLFADFGNRDEAYVTVSASLLGSSNRNFLDDAPVNRTSATRRIGAIEGGITLDRHRLILALDTEAERFRGSDTAYFGATDQSRRRSRHSATLEWTANFKVLRTDLAIRHDQFDGFKDATTLRGSVIAPLGGGVEAAATYGEGIAQPSFFDLYGFFPGSFVGNPTLRPERSRGGEVSLRYRGKSASMALTAYRHRLTDEIVGTYDPDTFLSSTANAAGQSRRRGIEAEARVRAREWLSVGASYAWLDASEPALLSRSLREQRRPRHSGSLFADGESGRWLFGSSLSFVGKRIDTNFDQFPAVRVALARYALVNARLAYRLTDGLEASIRTANLLNANYVDAIGYRTEGRSVHVGLRIGPRR